MVSYKILIPFIKLKEGGLSSAQTDTARNNPSPCGNGKNGFPYHTNKGIQWITFKSNASSLGYEPSCANFKNMPDSIWNKIYKKIYWDGMNCDDINNQAIANSLVEMAWGSGVGGAKSIMNNFILKKYATKVETIKDIVNFVNKLDKNGQTPELFERLYDYRKSHYKALNQPSNLKGWWNRLNSFYVLNKPYAISNAGKASLLVAGVLILTVGILFVWKKIK